jgi:hypothetical protein
MLNFIGRPVRYPTKYSNETLFFKIPQNLPIKNWLLKKLLNSRRFSVH